MTISSAQKTRYRQIFSLVAEIPPGRVASYGQIADYLPGVRARAVGFALGGRLPRPDDLPWHRVINAGGKVSAHPGAQEQIRRLSAEQVIFNAQGRIDWHLYRWQGPGHVWLLANGLDPTMIDEIG